MILEKLEFLQANILEGEGKRIKKQFKRTGRKIWRKIKREEGKIEEEEARSSIS